MDPRAAKLALARKKLKDHQDKKLSVGQKDDTDKILINSYPHESRPVFANVETTSTDMHQNDMEIKGTCNLTSSYLNSMETLDYKENSEVNVNVTEMLISNERNLEKQVHDLQINLNQLQEDYVVITNDYKTSCQKINDLKNELHSVKDQYSNVTKEIYMKDVQINELNTLKSNLTEKNNNLIEQLEFTKNILSTKEAENDTLSSKLSYLQNQYDVIHLQLQQLTTGSLLSTPNENVADPEKYKAMLQKISYLEQQLSQSQKERDSINTHYEHYVAELSDQLKTVIKKNEALTKDVQHLSDRENSLIDQISDMEIRIQNFNQHIKHNNEHKINEDKEVNTTSTLKDLEEEYKRVQDDLNKLQIKHEKLRDQYAESISKLKELSEEKATCNHDNISMSKLNADMASDKIAAQRATEQNKKLKEDLQGLQDAFVKMSKDKLELTEKLTAEKYLNRELTIKLAEIEEKANDMKIKLKAKDEEMIRLQMDSREIKTLYEKKSNIQVNNSSNMVLDPTESNNCVRDSHTLSHDVDEQNMYHINADDKIRLQKEDAMTKLQERFLKIMGDVAELSDEKHRLEHIILQLQTETDTICEYVALYQHQRILLKKRDEERSAQLKVFQQECCKLKCELEELSGILARFAEDKELSPYLHVDARRIDLEKVMTLLSNLKNNSLIDPKKKEMEFKNFYPCNCCSGKLIEV